MNLRTNGSNDPNCLDRIERNLGIIAIAQLELRQDLKTFRKGQVALGEDLRIGFANLSESMERFAAAQLRFKEKLKHTQGRIDRFITGMEP